MSLHKMMPATKIIAKKQIRISPCNSREEITNNYASQQLTRATPMGALITAPLDSSLNHH